MQTRAKVWAVFAIVALALVALLAWRTVCGMERVGAASDGRRTAILDAAEAAQ